MGHLLSALGSPLTVHSCVFLLLVDGPIWSALQILFTFFSIGDVRCVSLSWNWWSSWTALAKNVDLQVHSCIYLDCMLLVRGNEFHHTHTHTHIYIYIYIYMGKDWLEWLQLDDDDNKKHHNPLGWSVVDIMYPMDHILWCYYSY